MQVPRTLYGRRCEKHNYPRLDPGIIIRGPDPTMALAPTTPNALGQTDISPLDVWSFVHAISGAGMGLLEVNRTTAYGLIAATELAEIVFRRLPKPFAQESRANVIADLVVGVLAYELSR